MYEIESMDWKTTTQLLENLKNSDDSTGWNCFRDYFYPVIVRFAKRMGLNPDDAEDAAQETFIAFLKAYRTDKYQRQQGKLSHWVMGVARNVIRNHYRKQPKISPTANPNAPLPQDVEDEQAVQHTWQTEWRNVLLQRCLIQARKEFDSKTFLAFELYALEGKPVSQVCAQLNLSANAVYIAKNRVLTKIRLLYTDFDEK
jgi:RNA polymerase sigma factor (sigma-70 family)